MVALELLVWVDLVIALTLWEEICEISVLWRFFQAKLVLLCCVSVREVLLEAPFLLHSTLVLQVLLSLKEEQQVACVWQQLVQLEVLF